MAQAEHLPIYRAAFDLAVWIEKTVRGFSRYHKYTIGTDLRNMGIRSRHPCFLLTAGFPSVSIHRYRDRAVRAGWGVLIFERWLRDDGVEEYRPVFWTGPPQLMARIAGASPIQRPKTAGHSVHLTEVTP